MRKTTRLAGALLSGVLALTLSTGCSGDDGCEGEAYHPDLGADGSKTPIASLEVWLGTHEGLPDPPVENWIVVDSGEANAIEVVIKNDDGDGWWVTSARTDSGGWIVSSATDNAAACEDELS